MTEPLPRPAADGLDGTPRPAIRSDAAAPWWSLSMVAGVLAFAGSVTALSRVDAVYGRETLPFVHQAIAQDVVNAALVAPAVVLLPLLARRGSIAAHLLWLASLMFTAYNYVIYTMSVHEGPLFLVWVAVLGLSVYSLAGGVLALDLQVVAGLSRGVAVRTTGWFLLVTGLSFTALWLSAVVPAALTREVPPAAAELNLPSSPVHVLDLAFFLPAVLASAILLLRRRGSLAYASTPAFLAFMLLTGLPILLTPVVAAARGEHADAGAVPPISVVTVMCAVFLVHWVSRLRRADALSAQRDRLAERAPVA